MKKIVKIFLVLLFVLGTFYLSLPSKGEFPGVPNSLKSIEPGDTYQIANVTAYYTDMPRAEVVKFYFDYFSKSSFLGIPIPTYKLNQPPERIREVLRETQQSSFVEELIHPFKDSVFVNGFEWNNDPFTPPNKRIKNILFINGKEYQFKITLYYQESNLIIRLAIFYFILIGIYILFNFYHDLVKRWKKEI
jgi:hypothetical protein